MVIAAAYCSGGYQFDAREKPIFDSRITKFIFRSSGDLNFMILVEDCDTDGPSSMTVKWNTSLVLNSHIVENR